ncbi:WD repeat-containing protein 17 [Aphanomyces cochlioides]|nr:WD repeat-containing protein 17 [Aphanomyces cochlioides]
MTKLRQFRLLPSGCMHRKGQSNLHIVGGDLCGKYFAFCSTLAVYVFHIDTFELFRLLSTAENLVGMLWCGSANAQPQWLATVTVSSKVILYDVETEDILYSAMLPSSPVAFQWHPLKTDLVFASDSADSKSISTLFAWSIDHVAKSQAMPTLQKSMESHVTVIQFNSVGILALGFENGNLAVVGNTSDSFRIVKKQKKHASAIIDLQWDSLSTIYLLIATRDGHCALWEVTEQTGVPLHTFDKQGSGTTAIAWLPWASGLFVTANGRTGNVKLWNVSQTTPIEHFRVRPAGVGIHSTVVLPKSEQLLCASGDGSVGVYHVSRRQLVWQTHPGHKETIFDIRYQPTSSDVLATCGHDGTVRVWNVSSHECTHHLQGQEGITYSIAWSPHTATYLASASSTGSVYIWDLRQNAPIVQVKHHKEAIYCISWSKHSSHRRLATSSRDKSIVVFEEADGAMDRRYLVPTAAFGCEWHPDGLLLAVGCEDHVVRIFDVTSQSNEPLRVLAGHEARVFHTVWYPFQASHAWIASSADDCTIRVWTVDRIAENGGVVPYVTLRGHTNFVRALVWSCSRHEAESPFLLSGSWDASIRVWDVAARECRFVVTDHLADVYGIATHVDTPCIFVSCSRDTTIRFWGLSSPATHRRLLHTLAHPPWKNQDEIMTITAETSTVGGVANFFRLLVSTPEQSSWVIPPGDRLLSVAMERARRLESGHGRRAKPTKLNHADQLRQAAQMYLKAGALQKYCNLMIELDEWEAALAIAPAISMSYWQDLASTYANALAAKQDESAVSFYVATNQVEKAIQVFHSRGQLEDACIVAQAHTAGHFSSREVQVESDSMRRESRTATQELLHKTYNWFADYYSNRGDTVLAACCHLAVDQVDTAIDRLVRGDHLELAWILLHWGDEITKRSTHELVVAGLVHRCEALGDLALAMKYAKHLGPHEMAAVYARHKHPKELQDIANVPEHNALVMALGAQLADGKMVDAVRTYLLLDDIHEGIALALSELNEHIEDEICDATKPLDHPSWKLLIAMTHVLRSYDITRLDAKMRAGVLAFMALGGFIRAVQARYPLAIVSYLMHVVHSQCHSYNIRFPLTPPTLLYMEAKYASRLDVAKTILLLEQMEQTNMTSSWGSALKEKVAELRHQICGQASSSFWVDPSLVEPVVVAGSGLPSAGRTQHPVVSLFTGEVGFLNLSQLKWRR